MKRLVIAQLTVAGVHRWEKCPFEDVIYLANFHRHIFHIQVKKQVNHSDRDIEIIRLKNNVTRYLEEKYKPLHTNGSTKECYFNGLSCEMIAEDLVQQFGLYSCQVLEDGENGAEIISENEQEYKPTKKQDDDDSSF